MASMRSIVRLTGCSPPMPRGGRAGDVQRLGAQLRLQFGFGQRLAARLQGGLDAQLGWLISAPRVFFSSGGKAASALSSSVTRPLLPRKRALAFSSSAGVGAASKSAVAALTS
jgi:hypothetical protein